MGLRFVRGAVDVGVSGIAKGSELFVEGGEEHWNKVHQRNNESFDKSETGVGGLGKNICRFPGDATKFVGLAKK